MNAEHDQNGLPIWRDISFHAEMGSTDKSLCGSKTCWTQGPRRSQHGSTGPPCHWPGATAHGCPPVMLAAEAALNQGIGIPRLSFPITGFARPWWHCTKWDSYGVYHCCSLEVIRDSAVPWQLILPSSPWGLSRLWRQLNDFKIAYGSYFFYWNTKVREYTGQNICENSKVYLFMAFVFRSSSVVLGAAQTHGRRKASCFSYHKNWFRYSVKHRRILSTLFFFLMKILDLLFRNQPQYWSMGYYQGWNDLLF